MKNTALSLGVVAALAAPAVLASGGHAAQTTTRSTNTGAPAQESAAVEPAQECAGKPHLIYRAVATSSSTQYSFCDGTVVIKRPNGSMALRTTAVSSHPEYAAYTQDARAALEVAEHNAAVLQTQASQTQASRARAAFEARVRSFQAKYGWSKQKYYEAVKKSSLVPTAPASSRNTPSTAP
jgi:hypothetical protein